MFKLWRAASNAVLLNLICIQKSATCFVKLVLNELNSNDVRFTTYEKSLATLFVTRQVRTSVVKRETSLFNSFCSNVSKQAARFFFAARFTVA